jgi:hypothetical protein
LYKLWGNDVCLATRNKGGEEVVFHCYGPEEEFIELVTRQKYEEASKDSQESDGE